MYKVEKKKLRDVPAGHWVKSLSNDEYANTFEIVILDRHCDEKRTITLDGLAYGDDMNMEVLDFGPAYPKALPGNYIEAKDGSIWKIYIAGLGEQPEVGMVGKYDDEMCNLIDEINDTPLEGIEKLIRISDSGNYDVDDAYWRYFAVCVCTPEPAENPELKALKTECEKMEASLAEMKKKIKEMEK